MKMPNTSRTGFIVEWEMQRFPDTKTNVVLAEARTQVVKILLVSPDAGSRERIGTWLSEEGHEVLECPGPCAPEYTCLGGKGDDCPLAKAADVVVLDLSLASEGIPTGTQSWQLLNYYVERGHPVVAISGKEQIGRHFLDEKVITINMPVDREGVLEAIESASRRFTVMDIGTFRWTPRRGANRPY